MTIIFNICVQILYFLADLFGTDYYTINVVIFCIIGPCVFIFMLWDIIHLKLKIKNLQK